MNSCSTFVAEFEVTFSSYEAIKNAVAEHCQNDYKIDPIQPFEREYKMHELSDACVFEFRNCVYMIKPVPGIPTKFMVSSHTYWDATDLECFKACLTMLLKDLCETLDSQTVLEVEEVATIAVVAVVNLAATIAVINLEEGSSVASSNEVVVINLEEDSNEVVVASSNEVVDAWIDKYIEDNRIRSSNPTQTEEKKPLLLDDDIYVFDGVNIYE
jgi:hypothetical protein